MAAMPLLILLLQLGLQFMFWDGDQIDESCFQPIFGFCDHCTTVRPG